MDRRKWLKPVAIGRCNERGGLYGVTDPTATRPDDAVFFEECLEDFYSTGPIVYSDHEAEQRREKIRAKVSALKMRLGLRERMEHDA